MGRSGLARLEGWRDSTMEFCETTLLPTDRREVYLAGESPLGDLYVAVEGLGVSRLKDGKLMGVAPLYATQIQVVQNELWIAGGLRGFIRVRAASLRIWEDKRQD